jgi:hypothetical protein
MKTTFPAVMTGAALGALLILGAAVEPAAAWDYRDGGPHFNGPRFGGHHHGWDRGWGDRYRGHHGPRFHGPGITLYVPPPVVYYPAYPAPPPVMVIQLSACQQTVGNGLIERYGPGSLVFSGGPFEGSVTLDRQPFNYRCSDGQINIW